MTTETLVSPTEQATGWLDAFGDALARRDVDAALALFGAASYWRDLVAFTWNIRTQEGKPAIATMLRERLADVKPSGFAIEGEASEAGGITEAWFTFETGVSRGKGLLRLNAADKAWTLHGKFGAAGL